MREGVLILRTPLHLKAKHYNPTTIDHDILSIPAFLNHKIFIIIQYIGLLMYFVSFYTNTKVSLFYVSLYDSITKRWHTLTYSHSTNRGLG